MPQSHSPSSRSTLPLVYQVKNVAIRAMPIKTIVPITASTHEQAIAQAKIIAENSNADIAEFHINLLDFVSKTPKVITLGNKLNQILVSKPLIATILTHH